MKLPFAIIAFLALALLCVEISAEKTEWPELDGRPAEEAKTQIKTDRPDVTVEILPDGSFATMDYREDRVRVYVDEDDYVVGTPRVG